MGLIFIDFSTQTSMNILVTSPESFFKIDDILGYIHKNISTKIETIK